METVAVASIAAHCRLPTRSGSDKTATVLDVPSATRQDRTGASVGQLEECLGSAAVCAPPPFERHWWATPEDGGTCRVEVIPGGTDACRRHERLPLGLAADAS
jgi:hypothetical protein